VAAAVLEVHKPLVVPVGMFIQHLDFYLLEP
jgi:hypothetical protein